MKNYIVGILSLFDYELRLLKVSAENEYEALKQAMIETCSDDECKKEYHFHKTKQKQREFIYTLNQKFERFLELITEKTDKTFRKRPSRYDDWDSDWNEANLNGSFAYNGVTEDF